MPKFTKFASAPDGRLVYLNNGNIVRGKVTYGSGRGDITKSGYTVIKNRVYHNGRLAGYVTKPNKTQRTNIEKRAKARSKRAERKAKAEWIERGGIGYEKGSWNDIADAKRMMDNYRREPHSYRVGKENIFFSPEETGKMNFASALDQAVSSNILSIEEANAMWDEYINNPYNRLELWNELHQKFNEYGYEIDSPPLFGEIGRMLGLDISKYL